MFGGIRTPLHEPLPPPGGDPQELPPLNLSLLAMTMYIMFLE